jgi:Pentapeptide repeats (9 copies)
MTAPTDLPAAPTWPTCQAADGCGGIRVSDRDACLAHLDKSQLADWLATLGPGSDLDLRGTQVETKRLARLLTALHDERGRPRLGYVYFDGAQFKGEARFNEAQFSGPAGFNGAQFNDDAVFRGAQFNEDARFSGAQFNEDAGFHEAQFSGEAWFHEAQFSGPAQFSGALFSRYAPFDGAQFDRDAGFNEAQFSGPAEFSGAQFSGSATFSGARFSGPAGFNEAQFNEDARFNEARFSGPAGFNEAQFSRDAGFRGAQFSKDARFEAARFARPVTLGPLLVRGTLRLASASFEDTLVVEAVAARVRMDRATCAADVRLQLRYAEVVLDAARLAQPMTLAAADPFRRPTDPRPARFDETAFAPPGQSPTPRLLSVRATDVANLVVTDLTLAPCRFAGAHHLDQLRLEGALRFAQPPRGLRIGRAWPPAWWWTRRQTLAEEHAWRATRPKGAGWHDRETQSPAWLAEATGQPPRVIGPERLAVLYRALRQAQESRKNEPGAADFYYGEMEMRRLASSTAWAERVILFAYWLVAGYGLRGLRALAALSVVVVALAGLFHAVGFLPAHPGLSWWDSLLYTAGSTLSISDDSLKLTAWGKLLRIALRLLGPLLLGLALLSIRNRVKR